MVGRRRAKQFNNKTTVVDGIKFDSKAEAKRYGELKQLAKARKISMLKTHPRYVLQESFKDARIGRTKSGKPRTVRAIVYTADFQYFDMERKTIVVEDVKSPASKTQAYEIRKRLFLKNYPEYDFHEI